MMDYVVLTPAEHVLAGEKAAPTVRKVTVLLLRGGAMGFLDMERDLCIGSEEDSNISKDKRRVNPVLFKSIVKKSGVLLTPDEYRDLRTAYSDEGGFLVDEFLDLVCPLRLLGAREESILRDMCSGYMSADAPMILLSDVLDSFEEALSPHADATAGAGSLFASALMELRMVFTSSRYPKGLLPPKDVMNALAAILVNCADDVEPLLKCLAAVRLAPPPTSPILSEAPFFFTGTRSATRQKRGYEYYTDRDNRDEWLRGREEHPPRPMYLRHLPGYGGHLPTYCSKFGRSFHPIEESMPVLTHPKEKQMDVPPDRYGPAVELKGSWLTRHNYKLA